MCYVLCVLCMLVSIYLLCAECDSNLCYCGKMECGGKTAKKCFVVIVVAFVIDTHQRSILIGDTRRHNREKGMEIEKS